MSLFCFNGFTLLYAFLMMNEQVLREMIKEKQRAGIKLAKRKGVCRGEIVKVLLNKNALQ
ncbi:hypothetical protein MKX77_07620 [Bacillus sp. FSL R9-9410]|uniref:hypothetical protein n=1 Tax=Bacillus sp. FSL R9-9410 TaxID=2921590 RepID=UPI0031017EEE